ncbi:SidA/IucD/PvdA family monooxygenase [Tsukamurella sp. 8F]|uniref:lysine N(6)-hydroxylase/L-ornithine N(5)-oxygenase family protein n=1 Tax=unclassified Tsukamurella TaxID=2633480 RepID=UPI0023B8A29F|nr:MULTISPECIES: SidA/IucD/PvdA family monooxygenase [unclassified Tsukamurella]MDF0531184.1 SidA/IucD/PvdA family monooxygenase [Tsukamurella sp. 8J]MDF0585869.1 SidA/IucD/PvdA family monooxygenase [Tsukamurella sp. 8F]
MSVDVVDVVGIGAGPSNLGLAAAIDERNRAGGEPLTVRIFERKPSFGWHPGMLLDGATMQIAFLKDLVTLRNPRSPFGFLSYLEERGRLVDFVNHQTFFPTRIEFTDYLGWVADSVDAGIDYGSDVTRIDRCDGGDGARFEVAVTGPNGAEVVRARSVVVGSGLRERLPEWAYGPRMFHNHRILEHLAALDVRDESPRFLVVGGGQSAAEVLRHLHSEYPAAVVESVFNSYGFQPADDSPYANRVFDPDAVDDFFGAAPAVRSELMDRHRTTNYGCVDLELIQELYAIEYTEKVRGRRRLWMHPVTEVIAAREDGNGVDVSVRERLTGEVWTRRYAAVVCATGFRSVGASEVLAHWRIADNSVTVRRDYQLAVDGDPVPGLYVQGATEETHGLASTLLSNIAVRSGEILDSLLMDAPSTVAPAGSENE